MMGCLKEACLQIAMGVPWQIDETDMPMKTFRIGLFGLEKMVDIKGCVATLDSALDQPLNEYGNEREVAQ